MSNPILIPRVKFFTCDDAPVKIIGDGPADESGQVKSSIIRISPTPIGSTTKRDLHMQYFKAGTNFGDDIVQVKFGLYEHFLNDANNPIMGKMGKINQILGPARLVKVADDPTRWFDIEVRRSLEYHDWLMRLIDLKIMGASTQAFINSVEVDDDGGIDTWIENEVGPTVTPANPETIKALVGLIKSAPFISLPTFGMVKNGQIVDFTEESVDNEKQPELPAAASSLENELQAILTDGAGQEEEETEITLTAVDAKQLLALIAGQNAEIKTLKAQMSVFIELWGADIEEARQAVMTMMGNAKAVAAALPILAEIKTTNEAQSKAFLTFARWVKQARFAEIGQKYEELSQVEREILKEQEQQHEPPPAPRFNSIMPAGAPGTN